MNLREKKEKLFLQYPPIQPESSFVALKLLAFSELTGFNKVEN